MATKKILTLEKLNEYDSLIKNEITEAVSTKADIHDHPYLSSSTTYALSDSVGGAAKSADKVNITRPTISVLDAAAAMASMTEEIYFFGSDGLTRGAPVNYCIINAKRSSGERTILDCYDLNTGDHYINGNMTVTNSATWTGWILQPNSNHTHTIDEVTNLQTTLNSIGTTYETKTDATSKLNEAKAHTDSAIASEVTARTTAVSSALGESKSYTDIAVAQKSSVQIITWGADD